MADSNSSLPVKTLNNGDVVAQLADGTVTSQKLAIDSSGRITSKLNDGAGNSVTSQVNGAQRALDVGIDVAGVQIDPRSIRALTSADIATANQGAAAAITSAWPVKGTDGTNSQAYLATGEAKVSVTQPLPAGTNALGSVAINAALPAGTNLIGAVNLDLAGSPVSATNPVPVVLSVGVSGTIVNNYNTAASIAAGASSNHTYTITSGKSFQGKKIHAAGSGAMKIEVQTSPDGTTFTSVFVAFNSTAAPTIDIDMDEILFLQNAGTGAAIRIIRTNREPLLVQDLYSTISGVEV